MDAFRRIYNMDFAQDLISNGGEIYFVGGAVRDYLLDKKPKDIDLVVRNLQVDDILSILNNYGKAQVKGEAFGVILFKSNEGFEAEVALPRTDSKDKSLKGHKSIIAQSDPFMRIQDDLGRRDFTMNAVALTFVNGEPKFVDPYGGIHDARKGLVKNVNPEAFVDDPLRLLRAIQFAARFQFEIDRKTFDAISQHAYLINEITPERILMEFQKVIDKHGDVKLFASFLRETGLFEHLFGFNLNLNSFYLLDKVETLGEMLFVFLWRVAGDVSKYAKAKLKIDNNTEREIKALEYVFADGSDFKRRWNMFSAIKIYPEILKSKLVIENPTYGDFFIGKYPNTLKDIKTIRDKAISEFGLKGGDIGRAQTSMLNAIFSNKVNYKDTDNVLKFIKV